jgi:RNA polymerase sigma-70 factor (ECF subfamily)
MTATDDTTEQSQDAAILRRIVARDPQGIELLYDRYGGMAYALAYRVLGERGLAEDVVQEAFLSVWRLGATYDARKGAVRTWLLTIVHNRTIDQLRTLRAKRGADTSIEAAIPLPAREDTWAAVAQTLDGERVRAALATLPPEQRQVVDLAYFGGLTHAEIAARTGIPLGTVKGRMRLALEKLRDLLASPDRRDGEMEHAR